MKCCNEYGSAHGCNQGRACPRRAGTVSHWAPVKPDANADAEDHLRAARMSGGVGLPPADPAQHNARLTRWEVITFWAMVCISTMATAILIVGLAGLHDDRLGNYLADLVWALLTRLS